MLEKRIRTIYNILLVLLFTLLVSAPAIKMLSSEKMVFSFSEKRSLNSFPPLPESFSQLDTYFSDIETYLDDHFGFRDFLIYRYQREVRKRFGTTGDENSPHQGIDNWFFFGQTEMLRDFAGRLKLTDNQVARRLTDYQAKKQWLEERGIKYLLIVSPDKQSVYPEFVTDSWQKIQGRSRFQQFIATAREMRNNELLDLATVLKNHKSEPLFFKSDTHWTPYGAFIAFLAMAEKLERLFPSLSMRKEFRFTALQTRQCTGKKSRCGDLTGMLLDFEPFEESFREIAPFERCSEKFPLEQPLTNMSALARRLSFRVRCFQADLNAVVFRDSFFVGIEPFFSESVAQGVYLWKPYDQRNIEEISALFKPDIVIEEVVERNFLVE